MNRQQKRDRRHSARQEAPASEARPVAPPPVSTRRKAAPKVTSKRRTRAKR